MACLHLNAGEVMAGSHLWRFNEIFSNLDGTIQFIELKECCGAAGETALAGKWIASDASGAQYVIPENLVGPTSNKHLLFATAGFAQLEGAPKPDFIIPDKFLTHAADTLRYYLYTEAIMTYAAGQLPSDGILSLSVDLTQAVNSPTNYNDETGSIDVSGGGSVPAVSDWGIMTMVLLVVVAGTVLFQRRHPAAH
jgi:hypothetical protein